MRMVFVVSVTLIALGALGLLFWFLALRPVVIGVPKELPCGFPQTGFDHNALEQLLERFVTPDGKVHYQAWHEDAAARQQLDSYLAAVARYSPENDADRFPSRADRLAYWLNAYNACVIKGVLSHWPIGSVHDVRAPLELKTGMGFFWRLRFVFGGREINLYDLENKVIRARFSDPRVHFVLNCASEGCPVLRPDLPTGAELEPYLEKAAQDFLGERGNVTIDHAAKTLTLSAIFQWYEEEFLADLARRGIPASQRSLRTWLLLFADGDRKAQLHRAADYKVRFASYDWELNSASGEKAPR